MQIVVFNGQLLKPKLPSRSHEASMFTVMSRIKMQAQLLDSSVLRVGVSILQHMSNTLGSREICTQLGEEACSGLQKANKVLAGTKGRGGGSGDEASH